MTGIPFWSRLATCARVVVVTFAVSLLLAQNACVAVIPASTGIGGMVGARLAGDTGVQVHAPVEVRFRPVRDIPAVTEGAGRADTSYTKVVAILGRVRHLRGDTVWVIASEIRFPNSRITFARSRSPVFAIVRDEGATVRSIRSKATYAVVGGLVGFFVSSAVVIALALYAMSTAAT